jgi:hypothetical protein
MRLRKIAVWIGVPVGAIALILGGLAWTFFAKFYPAPPVADYPQPQSPLDAQHQDLDYLARLVGMDRAYSATARAEARRRIESLQSLKRALSWEALRVETMRIAALADNGHTYVFSGGKRKPNLVPLRVSLFGDGLYVLRAEDSDLVGAQVEAIDGRPVDDVLAALDTLTGGLPAWRRQASALWIQSPAILHATGIAPRADRTTWRFRVADGRVIERTLTGTDLKPDETIDDNTRWLSTDPHPGTVAPWHVAAAPMPLPLRNFDRTFRTIPIGKTCVLFLQMKAVTDGSDETIARWLDTTRAAMQARPPCAIVLDMRYNTGGDYTTMYAFANELPELIAPGGRVFVLTGPQSFSATITTTAFVKQAMGGRTTILGEPVGDRLRFFAEGRSGCLPHAGICFHYATGKHDYTAPCNDPDVCFWTNYLFPVQVTTLAPDETIHLTHADWLAGRDPVFDRAMALALRKTPG